MIVQLFLDRPNAQYTNLDVITGRVALRNTNSTNVSSIIVKLEGESKTRLIAQAPHEPREKPKPVLEVHKLLYRTATVWPNPSMQNDVSQKSFTIGPGQHEFPFEFKLPFNNACSTANSLSTNVQFSGLQVEIAKQPTRHIRTTLPPSLYFPGEAEIKYYVKVTVNRPSILKENPRAISPFNFFPIEPPRSQGDGECFARRHHQFNMDPPPASPTKKGSIFSFGKKEKTLSEPEPPLEPPRFSFDMRLQNPAIVTCGEEIPMRLLFTQLSERRQPLYMNSFQIELIGYTKVRAHDFMRTESTSWVICSYSNMGVPLGRVEDPVGTEIDISKEYWQNRPLPNTVAPTFTTCNISRYYEMEVRVGIGYGTTVAGKGETTILPLRLPVKVFSGIRPPAALLQAMQTDTMKPQPTTTWPIEKPSLHVEPPKTHTIPPGASSLTVPGPSSPTTPITPGGPFHQVPPQPGAPLPPQRRPVPDPNAQYDEAPPPSYEDAIAQDLPPIDGPRPDYAPPPPNQDDMFASGIIRALGLEHEKDQPFAVISLTSQKNEIQSIFVIATVLALNSFFAREQQDVSCLP
ncbi:hypothetical protein P152DRAFT_473873 [Eremomyces bilateralis CBS 781.70]|uniref:Arrestin-like N-terminal domain-containing protein n=1 Tax=Eremomyces bilateralis CBS 781.70 TaxID=1392243 RepID=A0A6G1G2W6_9PEZI|nr:uncharacterized protein P152DRAFT_473873 [Eremomyces bilateralis CBS 781.70]KAF1812149.1 hypothetical protein P152DRAFT_473873 [Eremomyces bilateralis CBS 781.70]